MVPTHLGQHRLLPERQLPVRECGWYDACHHNPDSWEGWYWGAIHHWGQSLRVGQCETYGGVEDCLENAEMIVFWSANPEGTSGAYGALEGTVRRQWLKETDIKIVHVDPYFNDTAQMLGGKWIAPKPTTSPALAMAIAMSGLMKISTTKTM